MRVLPRALAGALALLAAVVPAAASQQPALRLAAPADCLSNPGCGSGLEATYGLDVRTVFIPLEVPDGGVSALDDGLADVAVAFSTDPQVSRPDVVTLADDQGMIGPDRLVPVVRRRLLRALGDRGARQLAARMDRVGRLITTLQLRAMNQQVGDGRLPEAVGGEFVQANGLGVRRRPRRAPRITLGHQSFSEAATVAYLFAAALEAAGYRVRVVDVEGLRPQLVAALRTGRVDAFIGYSRSLARYLAPRAALDNDVLGPLRRALRRKAGATAFALTPGENRNLFVMKAETARTLGIAKLSDLTAFWPRAG